MNSYIACTFALIAALAYVSADAVTTSEAAAACTSGFKVKTYTNGVYALRGNTLVTTPGDNSDLKVVNEGGKFYLKLGNKYFCDSTEPIHGGYKVTACDKKEDSCEIQIRRCDAVGDRLTVEKPQPDCTTFYFPKTRHYLSAGVPDNLNQAVQSQDWCRTWEYSYLTCPAPTPSYGGGNGYGPPGGHGGYGPKNPSGNAGGYGGGNPGGNGGHGGGAGGYGSGQPKTPPAGGYGGGNPGGNGGHGGAGGYSGGQPKTPPAGGYGSHGGQGGYSGGNGGHGGAGGYSGGQPKTPPAGGQGGYGGGQPKTPPAGGYGGGSSGGQGGYGGGSSGGQGGYGAGGHGNGGNAGGYTSSQGGYGGKAPAKGGY